VQADESLAAAGAEAVMGRAVERRGCATEGLFKEETVRLSKFTLGREIREVAEARVDTSQEKVMVSISQQVDSFAEIGFLRAASQPINSAMATAALEKRE